MTVYGKNEVRRRCTELVPQKVLYFYFVKDVGTYSTLLCDYGKCLLTQFKVEYLVFFKDNFRIRHIHPVSRETTNIHKTYTKNAQTEKRFVDHSVVPCVI